MWCFSTPSNPAPTTPTTPTPGPTTPPGPSAGPPPPAPGGSVPPATPTPGGDTPAPSGPGAVEVCPCATAAVTSQMVMQEPPDRARTRMAVGERVELTYSLGDATWSPADGLSADHGTSVTFTAPNTAGTVTITATGGGCHASITLTIVEPETVNMIKRFSRANRVEHTHDSLTLAFTTNVFIAPTDVNFHAIQILELEALATGEGVLAANGGLGHHPNTSGTGFTTHVQAGMGTFLSEHDTVGISNPGPWVAPQTGESHIDIPWRWRVGNSGPFRRLRTVRQQFRVSSAGLITGTKAGARASVNFADPTLHE